jgi:hypothetical protein
MEEVGSYIKKLGHDCRITESDQMISMNIIPLSLYMGHPLQPRISIDISAIGTISSLVITVPETEFNITNAFKVILTGEWNLSVVNVTMTNFAVNFLASPMDGRELELISNVSRSMNKKYGWSTGLIVELNPHPAMQEYIQAITVSLLYHILTK